MKPLSDRVLIKPDPIETKTKSGLIIPDTATEKPQRGTVVAVGPGKPGEPMTVKKDDRVLYGKHVGTEVTIDGDKFIIMREADALAVL